MLILYFGCFPCRFGLHGDSLRGAQLPSGRDHFPPNLRQGRLHQASGHPEAAERGKDQCHQSAKPVLRSFNEKRFIVHYSSTFFSTKITQIMEYESTLFFDNLNYSPL